MAFDIKFYVNTSELNKIHKDITDIVTLRGTLKDQTSIIDPGVLIQGSLTSFVGANYAYIEVFGRYYYIHDIISVTNNLIEIYLHCDVLMSFADAILENTGIVSRQENNWNLYLDDGSFKTYSDPMIITKVFPNGFTSQSFALLVAGS